MRGGRLRNQSLRARMLTLFLIHGFSDLLTVFPLEFDKRMP